MKKNIYTITEAPTVIWRNNSDPSGDIIKTAAREMEKKFNKVDQYMDKDNLKFPNEILEEFPEYLAGWTIIITNTGLVTFYNLSIESNNFVIYDMFDDDVTEDGEDTDTSFLTDIDPDVSMLDNYNVFNQPLSVRKINFEVGNEFNRYYFKGERSFKYNNKFYSFYNCDALDISNCNFNTEFNFFESDSDIEKVSCIEFHYKPVFFFKVYDSNGNLFNETTIEIKINEGTSTEKTAKLYENGKYFIDLSEYESFEDIKISLLYGNDRKNSGYLEVI